MCDDKKEATKDAAKVAKKEAVQKEKDKTKTPFGDFETKLAKTGTKQSKG